MPVPSRGQVRGMRHVRGVATVPSLILRQRGRAERLRQAADIAAARAALQARRRVLTPNGAERRERHG